KRERVPFLRDFWFGSGARAGTGAGANGNGSSGGGDRGSGGPGGPGHPGGNGHGDGHDAVDGSPGLTTLIEHAMANADPAVVNAIPLAKDADGEEIVVRNGRYGPYVRRGDETATVPAEIAPDELTVELALELLAAPKGDQPIGTDPSGLPVYVKTGRYGPYVQLGDAETLPDGQKPKMSSLFKTMSPTTLTLDEALRLLSLPRAVGVDPATGEPIEALNGRYGPYLRKGGDSRSLGTEEELFTVTLDEALRLFAEPKRRGQQALRELGADPASGKPMVIKSGRYGPYVTDGETNASLRERDGDTVEGLTDERAAELLQSRRDAGPSTRGRTAKKATAKKAAKKATAKKATAKKATAKKATAKTTATAKKAAARRAVAGEGEG
ncbi:MAG TPA: topoisomerase C-terminal repeat-containing protein, partial [Acidimicrobiales bacterium]